MSAYWAKEAHRQEVTLSEKRQEKDRNDPRDSSQVKVVAVTIRGWVGWSESGMNKRLLWIIPGAMLCAAALSALDSDGRAQLKLVPEPKEVQLRAGGFQVGPRTKIFVQLGHQSEDRIAAETLAEQVADQSGLQLDIVGMKAAGKAEASSSLWAAC